MESWTSDDHDAIRKLRIAPIFGSVCGYGFADRHACRCSHCRQISGAFRHMDLSPLARFIDEARGPKSDGGAARTIWHMSKPGPIVRTIYGEEEYKRQIAEWEKHEPPPAQTTLSPWTKVTSIKVTGVTSEPTPSPLDKALRRRGKW